MPIVNDIGTIDMYKYEFKRIGYEYSGKFGIPGSIFNGTSKKGGA